MKEKVPHLSSILYLPSSDTARGAEDAQGTPTARAEDAQGTPTARAEDAQGTPTARAEDAQGTPTPRPFTPGPTFVLNQRHGTSSSLLLSRLELSDTQVYAP